ncbi:hypothetical protein EHS13_28830 [Paenibacillus psychroresistens]|uniref:Cytochrome c domain-containing protein n=1 Tax=Paenibacillus psychroresistens TaxID=1778678 RepID=A0A6B8RS75_9BACL|nr:cytochrome c [Paenibacillus psychroresistens]QGQ98602.1 hypothetical protein EHS13_28830 [Paenibacillus psychroresistens]
MLRRLSALLLSISIVVALTACGSDKPAESSTAPAISPIAASPTNSPLAEASGSPEATASPQATLETSATPVPTTTPEASAPAATPTVTPKAAATATPKATATAKPTSTAAPTPSPKPPVAVNSGAAEALFKQSCTSCHGVDLAGDFGPNLQKIGGKLTKAQITTQITNGGDAMPSFNKSLKAEEIQILAAWLAAKK